MKAEEFLKLATDGSEAGEVIKDNYLTEAIVKLLNNYADIRVKNCYIPDVSISLFCRCSQAKGRDNDENGTPYCIECQKPIDERQIL